MSTGEALKSAASLPAAPVPLSPCISTAANMPMLAPPHLDVSSFTGSPSNPMALGRLTLMVCASNGGVVEEYDIAHRGDAGSVIRPVRTLDRICSLRPLRLISPARPFEVGSVIHLCCQLLSNPIAPHCHIRFDKFPPVHHSVAFHHAPRSCSPLAVADVTPVHLCAADDLAHLAETCRHPVRPVSG